MDSFDYPAGRSPRRELQGPRPTPLKVRKDSHKIRKPPVPPSQQSQPQAQPRPPVIIYTVSPKVIHANPSEFMTLVQRLTGSDPSTTSLVSSSSAASTSNFKDHSGAISPAARFASIEKIRSPEGKKHKVIINDSDVSMMEGLEITTEIERNTGLFPGILSPNPASLQPISSNFFSPPPTDPNPLSFFHDLSPVLYSNKNYLETSFIMPSPSFISPKMPSPNTPSLDIFNSYFYF